MGLRKQTINTWMPPSNTRRVLEVFAIEFTDDDVSTLEKVEEVMDAARFHPN